jgi:hypothetical protein
VSGAGRRLEIVIDELVVRGLDPSAARAAASALEARLSHLAAQHEAPLTARAESFRRLQPVEVPAGSGSSVGEAVAGSVWAALAGGRS